MVGCVHPGVEDEVCVGGEVTAGQEQASVELLIKQIVIIKGQLYL
jgi:hypothetical protein